MALLGREQPVRIAEPVPGRDHDQHAEADPQVARDQLDGLQVAAMAGHQHELAQAGAMQRFGDLAPRLEGGRGGKRQRAGEIEVLVRLADLLHRQERHRQSLRQQGAHARQIGLADVAVDAERQMRPVLLDRRDRQHGDPAHRVGAQNVRPGHVEPVALGKHVIGRP